MTKGLYVQLGLGRTLAHLSRLGDEAAAVDFLNAMAGLGFPRWPDHQDLSWCALLAPILVKLLQSQYEE